MRTNPEKCEECKYKDTKDTEDPCFCCTGADCFQISQDALITRIKKQLEEATKDNKKIPYRKCIDGRMCYCAPFEEKETE